MTESDGPRRAHPEEFPEILDLVDRSFHRERGGMTARMPACYDESRPERHAIVRRDGHIVAHAAVVPQTLVLGNGEVDCPGIGGVATEREYRGEGHMSALLDFCLDRLDAPVVELGGDRTRYGRFGWENAGHEFRYRVTTRSLDAGARERGSAEANITRYEGDGSVLDRLRSLHADDSLRVRRNRRESARIFARRGTETLVTDGDDAAYLCFDRTSRDASVSEFGGSPTGIEALLGHVFRSYEVDALTLLVPPDHDAHPFLRRISTGWQATPLRKFNVRDPPALLAGFAPQMGASLRDANAPEGSVTLGDSGTESDVTLSFDGDELTVEPFDTTSGTADLTLSRRELTHLLFAFPGQATDLRSRHPMLAAALPLSYYIWPSERV